MAVVDRLEEPERRLDPGLELAVGDRRGRAAGRSGRERGGSAGAGRASGAGARTGRPPRGRSRPARGRRRPRPRDRRSRGGAPRAGPRSARRCPGPRRGRSGVGGGLVVPPEPAAERSARPPGRTIASMMEIIVPAVGEPTQSPAVQPAIEPVEVRLARGPERLDGVGPGVIPRVVSLAQGVPHGAGGSSP